MTGEQVNLEAVHNAGLYATFGVQTDDDITTYLYAAYAFDPSDPATALATFTVAADNAEKEVAMSAAPSALATILDSASQRRVEYVLLCRPGGSTEYRFFYGALTVSKGGPSWT